MIELLGDKFQVSISIAPSVDLKHFKTLLKKEEEYEFLAKSLEKNDVVNVSGLCFIRGNSLDHMNSVDSALVASGTATLECALCDTPLAVIYEMNPTTYKLAKILVKIKWASLVNLVGYKEVVREFIQHIDHRELADYLTNISKEPMRSEILESINELKAKLKPSPSKHAAKRVAEVLTAGH